MTAAAAASSAVYDSQLRSERRGLVPSIRPVTLGTFGCGTAAAEALSGYGVCVLHGAVTPANKYDGDVGIGGKIEQIIAGGLLVCAMALNV